MPVAAAVDLQNGFPFDSADFSDTGTTPLLRIRDLTASEFETYLNLNVPEQYMVRAGDLVIGMDGDFNAIIWKRDPAALNQRVCRLRARKGHDLRYVGYSLPAELKRINETEFATTVKHLSSGEILSSRIPSKSLEEQRRIADFLDDRVARIDQIIAARQQERQLAVEAGERATDRIAMPCRDDSQRRDPSDLPRGEEVPPGWQVESIGRLTRRITYGFTNPMPTADDGPYLLTANDVGDGAVRLESARHTTDEAFTKLLTDKSRPRPGDTLLTKDGTLGRVALFEGPAACVNQSVAVLTPNRAQICPELLAEILRCPSYQAALLFQAGGTTIKHLYISRVAKQKLALPPLDGQAALAQHLRDARLRTAAIAGGFDQSVALLQEYKQSLITAAVSGDFDVATASTRIPE